MRQEPTELDAGQLVRQLLAALGVELEEDADDATVAQAALQQIEQARSGRRPKQMKMNPLIPGSAPIEPMYMSLETPPPLSAEAEAKIVATMVRHMGGIPEPEGAALGVTREDAVVEVLVRRMGAGITR